MLRVPKKNRLNKTVLLSIKKMFQLMDNFFFLILHSKIVLIWIYKAWSYTHICLVKSFYLTPRSDMVSFSDRSSSVVRPSVNFTGFGYDLSDTQDELTCWRMGFIFCGKHPLFLTMILVSDPGPMGPLVLLTW